MNSMQDMCSQACRQCLSTWLHYLEAERVEAAVCLAANRAVGLNLHGVQQVLVTETGRPADLELGLLNAAGPKVMELRSRRTFRTS